MAAGRIQNRQLLAKAAGDLRVEGLKQAPAHLNLEQVLMTYDIGQRSGANVAGCSLVKYNDQGQSLAGLGALSLPIIGAAYTNPLFGPSVQGDATIAQLTVEVTYTGAGSTADAGSPLAIQVHRSAKYGSLNQVQCLWLDHWQHVQANQNLYVWSLGTYLAWGNGTTIPSAYINGEIGSRLIPQGDQMEIYLYRTAGGVWPADTNVIVQGTIFTDVCQPQLAWVAPT